MTTGASTDRPSGYYFITPVWGESYTKLYVDTVIPAQLAPGNLDAFRGQPNCRYLIYTRREDAELIRKSPVFRRLNECIPVVFDWLNEDSSVVHDMMTDCFRRGIEAAEDVDAAVFLMTPDIVYANGSFAKIKQLSESGHDVIFIPAIRTLKNVVVSALSSFKANDVVTISPRQLVRVALDNLHPLAHSSWWEEGDGGLIPANIYWRVDDEGIVAHCFHLHPILVRPQRKHVTFFGTVDDDYIMAACPDASRDCIVADSDDLFAVELSDPWRYFEMRFAKGSVKDTVRWAEQFTNKRHQALFGQTIRIHTAIAHPEQWTAVEDRARSVAQEVSARLNWPIWRLLFDADLIPRRWVRWTKEFRLKLANPHLLGQADGRRRLWPRALLAAFRATTGIRAALVDMMRAVAAIIERLASWPYRVDLERQLATIIDAPPSGAVFIASSPGKSYLQPWLIERSKGFDRSRYVAVTRQNSVTFLEQGNEIPDQSKDLALLEVDAIRAADIERYLQECVRILQPGGRLVIYLHHQSPLVFPEDSAVLTTARLIAEFPSQIRLEKMSEQGGLGTYLRVRLENWIRRLINRRLDLRGLLILVSLPLLPIIVLLGGFVVLMTMVLDLLVRSTKFYVSSLIVARK